MIRSFKSKKLAAFYRDGTTRGIASNHVLRLQLILSSLDQVREMPKDMSLQTFRTHKLKGDRKAYWSVSVNGNWRVIFRFEDGDVHDVDYLDYH